MTIDEFHATILLMGARLVEKSMGTLNTVYWYDFPSAVRRRDDIDIKVIPSHGVQVSWGNAQWGAIMTASVALKRINEMLEEQPNRSVGDDQ